MLAIILGFQDTGSTADFTVLYAGRDATAARAISENPPLGIVRTESLVNPITHRRRYFPANAVSLPPPASPEAPAESLPGDPPEPPDEVPADDIPAPERRKKS